MTIRPTANRDYYYCSSTDTKPLTATMPIGTIFYEMDTKCQYLWDGISWTRDPSIIYGAEKHPTVSITIATTTTTYFTSARWSKPGRTLINLLTTCPATTGASYTMTLTIIPAESTISTAPAPFWTSTALSTGTLAMLPVTTQNYGVPITDGGVYFAVSLSQVNESTAPNSIIKVTPYTM